ncbi:hypothetical protein ILUMI_18872 [Ignelater luminosus]|uniref:Uncharacterized protein n=1 Tax=Ignelater luminosus TaxID=2038154 RepID=A0A8K0CKF3_IGNLU|nr:hypothetical protein ILUMI_18872 [Ignelater luminosus]
MDGVKACYDKSDIPGDNDFTPVDAFPMLFNRTEEIFCSGIVKHYFQPVALIVADTQELAEKAADMVQVNYKEGKQKPLLTIRDIIAAKSKDKISEAGKIVRKNKGSDVKHVVKGTFDISWQYHYTMETQCCVVIPTEDGLDMYPSTQSMTSAQVAAAKVLKIPANKINVTVRRLGGAYGGKISRNALVSSAAALAAYKLKKPVKLSMPLVTNMNVIGKRNPFSMDYEAGVNDKGVIQYLDASLYSDTGSEGGNENVAPFIIHFLRNCYNQDPWDVTIYSTRSDCHNGTWCRAPATTEGIAAAENIMEHIATELNLNPVQVRLENMSQANPEVEKYITELLEWAEVDKRKKEIEAFNKGNRWVKRGLSVLPMLYPFDYFGYWHVLISIYQVDGTVSIAHGGVEMGQGINTKVAQVCAYALGIPVEMISIKPSNTLISPNAVSSGGSVTSEAVCLATLNACEILKERMKPIKEKMKNPTWQELVRQCYTASVDLCATSLFQPQLPDLQGYMIYGATCAEVEIDILTGVYNITRVDLLEDTGNSMSPEVDIGQVEGAFVMGIGYWTSEQIIFNEKGELLTNRTWNYKPPGAKDIPIDFRVKFPKNNPNSAGILQSKATAEPPLCMSVVVAYAIRNAIAAARTEANANENKWYPIDGPSTVEQTFLSSLHDYKQYTL